MKEFIFDFWDLNLLDSFQGLIFPDSIGEDLNELGTNRIRSTVTTPASLRIQQMRQPIWRKPQGQKVSLLRPIPLHGFRTAHLPGKPAGYRDMPELPSRKALSHWIPGTGIPIHPGRCERDSGLEDLPGFRVSSDRRSPEALPRRRTGYPTGSFSLCPGFHHDRSMPCLVSLGHISQDQRGDQDPHIAGHQGFYPRLHQHDNRRHQRPQHPGCRSAGKRIRRYPGPWLCGLQAAVRHPYPAGILCYSCQEQSEILPSGIPESGQSIRTSGRSDNLSQRKEIQKLLSGDPAACLLRGPGNQEASRLPHQYILPSRQDSGRYLQTTLADRVVFQVDQATPENQNVLRHISQCRQNTSMDCRQHLRARCHHEKAAPSTGKSPHNSTNIGGQYF